MNHSKNDSYGQAIVFGLLSIIFALISYRLVDYMVLDFPGYAYSLGFSFNHIRWFFLLIAGLCALPALSIAVREMIRLGLVPTQLRKRLQSRVSQTSPDDSPVQFSDRGRLVVLLGLCLVFILLFVSFIHQTSIVNDKDVSGRLYGVVATICNARTYWGDRSHVAVGRFVTLASDVNTHLDDLVEIGTMVKEAGAKALLVPLPKQLTKRSAGSFRALSVLDSLGIVVMGMHGALIRWSYGDTSYSRGTYGIENVRVWPPEPFSEFPLTSLNPGMLQPHQTDALVPMLLGYRNRDMHTTVQFSRDILSVGEDEIPVTGGGTFLSRNWYKPNSRIDFGVMRNGDIGEPLYVSHWDARSLPDGSPAPSLSIAELGELVRDKAVILASSFDQSSPQLPMAGQYAAAFENIVTRRFLHRLETGYLWFSAFVLALGAFISYLARPLLAAAVIFLLAVASMCAGSVLYESYGLLIDILYPLLALGIASFTFPLLKFAVQSGGRVM